MRFLTLAMKANLVAIALMATLVSPASSYGGFSDVESGAFYADAVAWMADEGIVTGYAPGCFGPDLAITRGDALVMLWRLNGQPDAPAAPFTDITADYQRTAIGWAFARGITVGTSATTVAPDSLVTRGDFVTLLARYVGANGNNAQQPFQDIVRPYQVGPIAWAVTAGVTTGTSPTTFHPERSVTRGEAATFIWRMQGRPSSNVGLDVACGGSGTSGGNTLDCVPDGPSSVGWRGAGLRESDLTDRRTGDVVIRENGAILENFDITGRISVEADNVIIRRGRIRFAGTPDFAVIHNQGTNLLIEDVEIDGADDAENGVWLDSYTARRVDIHSVTADAFKASGDVLIENVVAHDRYAFATQAHADAVQIQFGTKIVITCSLLDWGLPDGYSANDVGVSVSGGQGIWAANNGGGARIDEVLVHNVIVNAAGYPLGIQTETFGSLCNVIATADTGWGAIHPSATQHKGTLEWSNVIDGATGFQLRAPSGPNVISC